MFFLLVVFVILIISCFIVSKKQDYIKKKYSCHEGKFGIKGKRNSFKIEKDNRFVFNVVNGQIVSCVDRYKSNDVLVYGGVDNATNI